MNNKWGMMGRYENSAELYHACEAFRDAGYRKWDAHSPFPVHGLEKAMGLKASILPWLVLVGGITGASLAMGFMIWTSAFDYPLNIGGKPLWSVPAFIPVTFELTVLFSAFTTFFGVWILCRLPQWYFPAFNNPSFDRMTDDKFFITVEASDSEFDEAGTRALFEKTGASLIEDVES